MGPGRIWSEDWLGEYPDAFDLISAVPLPTDHPAKRHFGFGQNDAGILGFELGRDSLTLTVNHYDIERLAYMFQGEESCNLRSAFPVTFRFNGVSEFVVLRAVEEGVYQKIRHSQSSFAETLWDVVRLECVQFTTDEQHYVLDFNFSRGFSRSAQRVGGACGLTVCLVARSLGVTEGYREGWGRAFKRRRLEVLDAFDEVWPVTGWSMRDFEHWLKQKGFL